MFGKSKEKQLEAFSSLIGEGVNINGDLITAIDLNSIILVGDVTGKIVCDKIEITGTCSAKEIFANKVIVSGILTGCNLIQAKEVIFTAKNVTNPQCVAKIVYEVLSISPGVRLNETQLKYEEKVNE